MAIVCAAPIDPVLLMLLPTATATSAVPDAADSDAVSVVAVTAVGTGFVTAMFDGWLWW